MPLPDPDIALREAADYIFTSRLGQKAQRFNDHPGLSLFWRDLLGQIHRLVASCHMPEFTDHGLPHLCSLVERISEWTCAPSGTSEPHLVDGLSAEDAAVLLTATLIHDIGMLSQSPADLPANHALATAQGGMEITSWVRKSHVPRIQRLVLRLLGDLPRNSDNHRAILGSGFYTKSLEVAEAHSTWPWDSNFRKLKGSLQGLAAVLSIVDILDEDSARCDTPTLLHHRHGSQENRSHWIRHTLTAERVYVLGGKVAVKFVRLPSTDLAMEPVYLALRNHYRIVRTYNDALGSIGTGLIKVAFEPASSCPEVEVNDMRGWENLPGFESQELLRHNLLKTFFSEALLDKKRLPPNAIRVLKTHGLKTVDLNSFYSIRGTFEVRSPIEEEVNCMTIQ